MHPLGHQWTTLALVVIVASAIGCRGSRPFGRTVQVTQEVDADLPEIDPPRQRLATTKPRDEGRAVAREPGLGTKAQLAASQTRRPDGSPHVNGSASSRTDVPPPRTRTARTRSTTAVASQTAATNPQQRATLSTLAKPPASPQQPLAQNTPTSKTAPSSRQAANAKTEASGTLASNKSASSQTGSANTASAKTAVAKSGSAKTANPVDMQPAELMEAFSDYPPEVQREALRRLVAETSRFADRTAQPNALDSELAKNVLDLPKLPKAKNETPQTPPTRIATEPSNPTSAVASITDSETPQGSSDDDGAQGSLTDLVTTDLESTVVQTISDSSEEDASEVKRASASLDSGDETMIAQAAVEPSVTAKASTAKPESGQLSDEALFKSLLTRLSTPVPGESEAERSSRLIRLRHMMVLAGDPDAAVEQIDGMSKAEQEFLRHQLLGLWTMIDPQGHPVPSRRITTALPQIREAAKFAAAATDSLEIRSLAFCTEIESYGQIKTFEGNRFDAGQQVILYCEIENFTVNKTEEGFETHLQGSYDIYDKGNEKVVSQLLPADQQVSANYLRDYFIAYQMHLPQQLTAGTYRLQLTMQDVNGKKYGQASIPLEIAK